MTWRRTMSDVPIRSLTVSDFRRIEGTREFPLDAPVILIHGPNGTGKTSLLSALELALTGEIRSMERHSDRYRAHLPFLGQSYATVRVDIAQHLQGGTPGVPLTVSGSRLEGAPALNHAASKFYAERCYLDQSSLGRLLDLYQAREGSEQTALEKFVNELLGLEKLDALLSGLSDASDFRLLKKLAAGVDEADREAKAAAADLKEKTGLRTDVRAEAASARQATRDVLIELDLGPAVGDTDIELMERVRRATKEDTTADEFAVAERVHQELVALGGRIAASVERPTTQRIEETRAALASAIAAKDDWERTDRSGIDAWEREAQAVGVDLRVGPSTAVQHATHLVVKQLEAGAEVEVRAEAVGAELGAGRAELEALQKRLSDAHENSSALVEGLTALRSVVEASNICPICDRDITEIRRHSLRAHVDAKLDELTSHGQQLVKLRADRDELAAKVSRLEVEHTQLTGQSMSAEQRQVLQQRHSTLLQLASAAAGIEAAKSNGAELTQSVRGLQQTLRELEAAGSEDTYIRRELDKYAVLLNVTVESTSVSFQSVCNDLLKTAKARVSQLADKANHYQDAIGAAASLAAVIEREQAVVQSVAEAAERKKQWDDRITEAKRRQGIAREVREAVTKTRTEIVHRVFTESLNEVWKTVFTRLAPNEGFIPRFGVPSATKKTFDINLETTHRNGEAGGPPQMMLSAGNLNTAALSLFLALHLAVQPVVPCLVFDDPVQAMDEVHVAQFAGLIRLLSKQNGRQVIIAVHERELFDYLALELSPAYAGDELITIELGERADDEDQGINRHSWVPDVAIAG
ncbi:AAA family ATPase [Plantibacter cousiniae (nom. nud.)]|uniref:AAA family ATPase n=1 Tax=Plantibacter cousiniae (nom. nud.) TaxID=199709 RepID=UPI001E2F158C|nr:AAA family ATPase [Plantibacter cousiniae]